MKMRIEDVEMIRGKCSKCAHVFDVTLNTMPLAVLSKAIADRQTCPICGNVKMNMLDRPRELTRAEKDRHDHAIGLMKRFPEPESGDGDLHK